MSFPSLVGAVELDAAELDAADPLANLRHEFDLPKGVYLIGNSLGALPRAARDYVGEEFDRWATLGGEGHFSGQFAWETYHELLTQQLADLTGAQVDEVVAMNSLTVNLHLLLVSFYRPTTERHKVLIEDHAFPSDHFAVESQIRQRGFDPETSLVKVASRPGEETLRTEDLLAAIIEHGEQLALVLLPGVQYYTGQVLPMAEVTATGHRVGAYVGFDLAHAVGNIELNLHDWCVDFAVWCSYKYLNGGPGGVGGAFVHCDFVENRDLSKFLGWWGADPATRFQMATQFEPIPTVESWQLSNAPILPMAALRASLDVIDRAGGMGALREKSERQIEFFDRRLAETFHDRIENITPKAIGQRGCQQALRIVDGVGPQVFEALREERVFCDWREPDVIRVAPVPLYNSFADIDRFVDVLDEIM
ncbi:MAG: kynureninase [Acidimicrobiales bacterium]|nr:kynureninase [Acidimicrobiales bacterium]